MADDPGAAWHRARSILEQLFDAPPDQQARLLATACGPDAALRQELAALLAADAAHGSMPDDIYQLAPELVDELQAALVTGMAGATIGPYRLVRLIAHGGMAVVYRAERSDGQFEQEVAIKLLRSSVDAAGQVELFRAERQILASLNHPNIARLLDGGMTTGGIPFIVMEYVEGEPIDRYCAHGGLTLGGRLALFLQVADAVRYAHAHLVVHRDLKPSNILVTRDGQVKLLDFGIAKLFRDASSISPPTPRAANWITPEYAAPEQLGGGSVTTATDVYQLGAVLYELLCGRRPFSADHALTPEEVAVPPSAAVRDSPAAATAPANPGATRRLRQALRGDLDAIALKALRPEPEQRYISVDALHDDVSRHLAGAPVRVRAGSVAYRARKFVRRNRWAVAAAAGFLLSLGGYGVTVSAQARTIRAALADVMRQKERSDGVTRLLLGLFEPDAEIGVRESVSARALLDRGERQAGALQRQPLAQAEMLAVLGRVHHAMRSPDRAQPLLERSLALRRQVLGDRHPEVAQSLLALGAVLRDRGQYDQARGLYGRALDIQRRVLGNDDPAVAESLYLLSRVSGTPIDESLALNREALAIRRRAHGPRHPLVAEEMMRLAAMLRRKGDLEEAETLLRDALAMRTELLGPVHIDVARNTAQLAILLAHKGENEEAERLHEAALSIRERLGGPDHPDVADGLHLLASFIRDRGDYEKSIRLLRRALRIRERAYGPAHVLVANTAGELAESLRRNGQLDEAMAVKQRDVAIRTAALGAGHSSVAGSMAGLGEIKAQRGDFAEAEVLLRRSHAIRANLFGAESPSAALGLTLLAELEQSKRQLPKAESLYLEALRIYQKNRYVNTHVDVTRARAGLVAVYDARGDAARAASQRALLPARN